MKSKRILSLVLTAALCLGLLALMPITASAAPPAAGTTWTFTDTSPDETNVSYGGGTYTWVQSTLTLTLSGVNHTTSADRALRLPAYATINLIGANAITSTFSGTTSSTALSAGNLTIGGNGSLTATGGQVTAAMASNGVNLGGADLIIRDTANVTFASYAAAPAFGYGIANTNLVLNGGTVTAIGNRQAFNPAGYTVPSGYKYYMNTTTAPSGTELTGNGTTTKIDSTQRYAKIVYVAPPPVAPTITGPTSMALHPDYTQFQTGAFTVTGSPVPTVTITSGDAKFVWNDAQKRLTINPGLAVGDHIAVLTASNGVTPDATLTYTFTVVPPYTITLSPTSWNPSAAAESTNITVTSNVSWSASSDAAWLTVSPPAGGSNNGTLTISAAANTDTVPRIGTITVAEVGGFLLETVAVTQEGIPTYTVTVVNGTGGGDYAFGQPVDVTADAAPEGKVFTEWLAIGVTLDIDSEAAVRFAMPANDVTLTAVYADEFDDLAPVEPPLEDWPHDKPSSWARDEVASAIGRNLVPDDLQMNYKAPISRLDFCRMAVRFIEVCSTLTIDQFLTREGLSRPAPFDDCGHPDVLAAAALGIVEGVGGNLFAPEREITRAESATMLTRTLKTMIPVYEGVPQTAYSDQSLIRSWAREEINFMQWTGVMTGTTGNRFDPLGDYTIETSIVTFERMWVWLDDFTNNAGDVYD